MRDSSAVVVLYVGLDGGQDARVLWPNSITFTKDKKIVALLLHDAAAVEDLLHRPDANVPCAHDAG